MNKKSVFAVIIGTSILVSGCGKSENATKFVDVDFSGMDKHGEATTEFNYDKAMKTVYDVKGMNDPDLKDDDTYDEIEALEDIEIELSKAENLSNGDKIKVKVSVPEDVTKVKSSTKNITVKGLEKPKELTDKIFKEELLPTFKFKGSDGFGKIEETYQENLKSDLSLTPEHFNLINDGKLENGKYAEFKLNDLGKKSLSLDGYDAPENKIFKIKVEGLEPTIKKAADIKNLTSLNRRIDEKIKGLEKSREIMNETIETKLIGTYYRPFNQKDTKEPYQIYKTTDKATYFKLFEFTILDGQGKERSNKIEALGFTNLSFDDNKNVKTEEMEEYRKKFENNESVTTIKEDLKTFNYSEVQ